MTSKACFIFSLVLSFFTLVFECKGTSTKPFYLWTTLYSGANNGLTMDMDGNIIFVDTDSHTINKLTPNGTVSVLAGLANNSGSADGVGSAARFLYPSGVAVDRFGFIYVADTWNHTIRKLSPSGLVTTIAGSSGNSGSADGTNGSASFYCPTGVAVDRNGNIYVADSYNDTIRKVTTNGVVTTLAGLVGNAYGCADGTGQNGKLYYPYGLATDSGGNVYVANYGCNTIRKITTNGVVNTIAGLAGFSGNTDGIGSAARFFQPAGICLDANTNFFVADRANNTIRKITSNGAVTTVGGTAGIAGSSNGPGTHSRFYYPNGIALDANGNLFVSDSQNNLIREGIPYDGAPIILTQPSDTLVPIGSNTTLYVVADGISSLSYQWYLNNQLLSGQAAATLTISNAQNNKSGSYFVMVTNLYGSTKSSVANLSILAVDTSITLKQISQPKIPNKPVTKDSLVIVAHGFIPSYLGSSNLPSWVIDITNAIQSKVPDNWQVYALDWSSAAYGINPGTALGRGKDIGTLLGQQLSRTNWQRVHLISHSAGAGVIQAIANQLAASTNPPVIQLTFLDPFTGIFHEEQDNYGQNVAWSDCYSVEDFTGGFTSGGLNHAYNVDVSWVDPAHQTVPYGLGQLAFSTHEYLHDFYLNTITNTSTSWCGAGYGFKLTQETYIGPLGWPNLLPGYSPIMLCGPSGAAQNPSPGFSSVLVLMADANHAISSFGASLLSNTGFLLSSLSQNVAPSGIHTLSITPSTNSPAWFAIGLSVTNAINFVQFDSGFTDTNAAQGLVTTYWNTNQIGTVDERVSSTGFKTSRFMLPTTVTNGLFILGFRLDAFNNTLSSVAITNVAVGFVGATQPITLNVSSFTNRVPTLQIVGPSGYNYLLQSSTNLLNWTLTAWITNSTGTIVFTDFTATNSGTHFYRAIMP